MLYNIKGLKRDYKIDFKHSTKLDFKIDWEQETNIATEQSDASLYSSHLVFSGTLPLSPLSAISIDSVIIQGEVQVGQILYLSGTVEGNPVPSLNIQWIENDQAIEGADKSYYEIQSGNIGKTIRVQILAFAQNHQPISKLLTAGIVSE